MHVPFRAFNDEQLEPDVGQRRNTTCSASANILLLLADSYDQPMVCSSSSSTLRRQTMQF